MNRLVNILMIFILVSCPIRCLMQGCGCFTNTDRTCCSSTEKSAASCCLEHNANCCHDSGQRSPSPKLPQKCRCNCFCSGAIVADSFSIPDDGQVQPTFDSDARLAAFANAIAFSISVHKTGGDGYCGSMNGRSMNGGSMNCGSMNRGRQICCRFSSFLI